MFQELLGGSQELKVDFANEADIAKRISLINLLVTGVMFPGDTQNVCSKLEMRGDCLDTLQKCFAQGDENCKEFVDSSVFLDNLAKQMGNTTNFNGTKDELHIITEILKSIGMINNKLDASANKFRDEVFTIINNMFPDLKLKISTTTGTTTTHFADNAEKDSNDITGPLEEGTVSIDQRYLQYCAAVIHKVARDNEATAKEYASKLRDQNKMSVLKYLISVYCDLQGDAYAYKLEPRKVVNNRPDVTGLKPYTENKDVLKYKHAYFNFITHGLPFYHLLRGGMTGGSVYPGIQFGGNSDQGEALKIVQSFINRKGVLLVDYLDTLINKADEVLKMKGYSLNSGDKEKIIKRLRTLAKSENEIYKIAFYINSLYNLRGYDEDRANQSGGSTSDFIGLINKLTEKKSQKQQRFADDISDILKIVKELNASVEGSMEDIVKNYLNVRTDGKVKSITYDGDKSKAELNAATGELKFTNT
jgi:hypothetical protein